jgi:hypothetical protein
MVLLAILIGAPADAVELFPKLWLMALAKRSPGDSFQGLRAALISTEGLRVLQEKIGSIVSDANFPETPDLYMEWIPRVSRFSFDVGRMLESTRFLPATGGMPASGVTSD